MPLSCPGTQAESRMPGPDPCLEARRPHAPVLPRNPGRKPNAWAGVRMLRPDAFKEAGERMPGPEVWAGLPTGLPCSGCLC